MNTLKAGNVDEKDIMCLSVLSLCRGNPGIFGAFDFDCLPHPWELNYRSEPQGWGHLIFFCQEEWSEITSSHAHLEIVTMEKNTGVLEVSTCFQGINQLLLTTHFQYILIECLTLWRLCEFFIYRLTIKHWNSNISHPLTARDYASLKMNRHLKGKMP